MTFSKLDLIGAEETFIVDVQINIHWLMKDKGVSRKKMRKSLGWSKKYFSKMFEDDAENLTLRNIAKIFKVLGEDCKITSQRMQELIPAKITNS